MVRRKTAAGRVARLALLVALAAFAPGSRAEDGKKASPARRRAPAASHGAPARGSDTQPKKKARKARKPAPAAPTAPVHGSASAAA